MLNTRSVDNNDKQTKVMARQLISENDAATASCGRCGETNRRRSWDGVFCDEGEVLISNDDALRSGSCFTESIEQRMLLW